MVAPVIPAQPDQVLAAFDQQAAWCAPSSPFSARVLQRSRLWLQQQAPALHALAAVGTDPLAAAVALRWLSGLHLLALAGKQPWAQLWPPATGLQGLDDAAQNAAIDDAIHTAWSQQAPTLRAALLQPPQTNEVQRSAALLPGLLTIAARTGLPLVLLEIGASAGLNLWCDHYRHEHDSWTWNEAGSAVVLRADWAGSPPPLQARLHITRRAGCDANPIDLDDAQQAQRLASYIWADQSPRLQRLRLAQQVATACMAKTGVRVQTARAADFLRMQLAQRRHADHLATVLMHSVVWQYIPAAEQRDITAQMLAAGAQADARAPLAWLRFEPAAADALSMELRCRIWPGGDDHLLARCHPHGAQIHWLAG